jgi:hypothetical protein
MKAFLMVFGFLSAALIVAQLTIGQLIVSGHDARLIKTHQHTGYLTVVVALVYILFSLMAIASMPKRDRS